VIRADLGSRLIDAAHEQAITREIDCHDRDGLSRSGRDVTLFLLVRESWAPRLREGLGGI
jgi:hypothetical protein